MRISRKPSPLQIMIGQKQPENVEYFDCLGGMMTDDMSCTHKTKCSVAVVKAAFEKKNFLCNGKFSINLKKKLVMGYI